MLISHWILRISFLAVGTLPLIVCSATRTAQTEVPAKIFAQKLVTETLAAHAELMGFELAATPPGKDQCVTIASNEAKGIGEKCDKDEFAAMKTNKPFVEKEKENGKGSVRRNHPDPRQQRQDHCDGRHGFQARTWSNQRPNHRTLLADCQGSRSKGQNQGKAV
jgi:hypothetical protein